MTEKGKPDDPKLHGTPAQQARMHQIHEHVKSVQGGPRAKCEAALNEALTDLDRVIATGDMAQVKAAVDLWRENEAEWYRMVFGGKP
jgi:hypothetical protein